MNFGRCSASLAQTAAIAISVALLCALFLTGGPLVGFDGSRSVHLLFFGDAIRIATAGAQLDVERQNGEIRTITKLCSPRIGCLRSTVRAATPHEKALLQKYRG